MIRYRSTRGGEAVSFSEALLRGLAGDGGLYLPTSIPKLPFAALAGASSLAELGERALAPWLGEEFAELGALMREALTFPAPLVELEPGLWVLELFHGPTLSFKDFGARTMARLMQRALEARGERRIILVATSGDTGSAVADGFAGMANIRVVLLYPKGRVSPVQERQLICRRPGVMALAVEGSFDDCQRLVKAALVDAELSQLPLSSANSINIGRLLPQMLYYLWAARQSEQRVHFSVPSGNLGNLTAGVLASLMSLGTPRLIAAHNANRFFPEFLAGKAAPYAFYPTVATLSNAMDVGAPSNFERLYALLGDQLPAQIWGTSVDDATTLARMQAVYERYGYLVCPHTAVGLEGLARYRRDTGDAQPAVALACAHPAKFPETVARALGVTPREPRLEALWQAEVSVREIPPTLAALKAELLAEVV